MVQVRRGGTFDKSLPEKGEGENRKDTSLHRGLSIVNTSK